MTKRRKQHIRSPMQVGHYLNRDDQPSGIPEYEIPPVTSQFESRHPVQASRAIGHTLRFIIEIIAGALLFLKPLITFGTALFFLFLLLGYGYRLFQELILDTVCPLPLVGQYLPVCKNYSATIPDFTHFVKLQESLYDTMLSRPRADAISALELKRVELATRDLQAMVKHSNLLSSDLLEIKLGEYVQRSRQFGRDLQSLQAQTRGVIDNLITYNTFTLRKLSEVQAKKSSRQDLRVLYETAMALVEKETKRLILAIDKAQGSLFALEEDLYAIHEITIQERSYQESEMPDVLASLINRVTSQGISRTLVKENLKLLVSFDAERVKAAKQLMMMRDKMETFQMDLEELRSQVVAPILVPDTIPLEMHIENIGKAIERLKSSKVVFLEDRQQIDSSQ